MKTHTARHSISTAGDAATERQHGSSGTVATQLHLSQRMSAQRQSVASAFGTVAQLADPSEEELQMKSLQRLVPEAEIPLQGRLATAQLQGGLEEKEPLQPKSTPNHTGMPDALKAGIESLSGMDLSSVRVHANSDKPAQLNALAYAQGNDIHLGPGQEKHLPHEAWHVVQQRQGRVAETARVAGTKVNDDAGLEQEADAMGGQAVLQGAGLVEEEDAPARAEAPAQRAAAGDVAQRIRFVDAPPRGEGDKRYLAPPFQLATVQFAGTYDIQRYAAEIIDYARRCKDAGTIPVVELRQYDAALKVGVTDYLTKAREQLRPLFTHDDFDVTCTILRDETATPEAIEQEESDAIMGTMREFAEWLAAVKDTSVERLTGQRAERKNALDQPAGQMLAGRMMIPLEEAIAFANRPPTELQEIYNGAGSQRYSLHHRALAKVMIMNADKRLTPSRTHKRMRRNSLVRPDTVTLTNLVTGTEQLTLGSTLAACNAAFQKQATQVLLIIETRGEDGARRAATQIEALQRSGYVVEFIEKIRGAKGVQQSGVALGEPEPVPERIKIRVRKAQVSDADALVKGDPALNQWEATDKTKDRFEQLTSQYTYSAWYAQFVAGDKEEFDHWSAYFPHYQDELCGRYPHFVVHIHDMDPGCFRNTYPHHQKLYEKQRLQDQQRTG
ncbi:DUF4157 domain-containing protein [Rhizobacter sp. Root1221]|uniref:eCIS core domain-containing protein n=1 Tax=Rhizobacter sp. Root1221 TaxID=1736433 RepID=UPI000AFCEC96|nr:DUF4157 domain-containing protein [Rhizobacter sp. Root1221]